jgi:transcriptional regulator with PAS, ATPase and Fis domain
MDQQALHLLSRAPFPGNIRELENEIERALTLADDNTPITSDLLSPRFHSPIPDDVVNAPDGSLKEQVETLEKKLIMETLKETNGNILQAAKKLKLSRAGLHKKLNRYRIHPKDL